MNKLNNKGTTLVELIISFMIVTIASIYLYQTLIVVSKLYKTSRDETNQYVDINYAYRIIDALAKKGKLTATSDCSIAGSSCEKYFKNYGTGEAWDRNFKVSVISIEYKEDVGEDASNPTTEFGHLKYPSSPGFCSSDETCYNTFIITFAVNGKEYKYYYFNIYT